MPSKFTGCLHPSNGKNCLDWHSSGLLAYGCHNTIFIIDSLTNSRIQSIDFHKTAVSTVRFRPSSDYSGELPKLTFEVASADIGGNIVVFDALEAAKIAQFSQPNTSVLQMQWQKWRGERDTLLVLHSTNILTLWNGLKGEKLWSKTYFPLLFDFSMDPFCAHNVAFSTVGNKVMFFNDIKRTEPISSGNGLNLLDEQINPLTTNIFALVHHQAYRNIVFVIVNNFLYICHQELICVLSKIQVEGSVINLLPVTTRDAIFTVHTTGAVSLRIGSFDNCIVRNRAGFAMEKVAQTECVKRNGTQRIVAASLCPATQSNVAVMYQNGRLAIWTLKNEGSPLKYRASGIEDFLDFDQKMKTSPIGRISLHQLSTLDSFSSAVTCVRMRPMDELATVENDPLASSPLGHLHLAAVGTNTGVVHLIDVFSGDIFKSVSVQLSSIKCLEWGGAYSLVTAGYNCSLSSSHFVRNDLFVTDIRTGVSRRIRPEADESPISIIRVSFYHCYLAIAFEREPLEIWDLKGLKLLRQMKRSCPLIVDMAWSNKHHDVRTTDTTHLNVYKENLVLLDNESHIYHISLRGLHVRDGKMVKTQWKSANELCAIAWKDDILAVGDVVGNLVVWDLGRKKSQQVMDSTSRITRMSFSRLTGDRTLAVLHGNVISLWDTEEMSKQHAIRAEVQLSWLDADLCGLSPLILANDNQLRLVNANLVNVPVPEKELPQLCNKESLNNLRNDWINDKVDQKSPLSNLARKKTQKSKNEEMSTVNVRNELIFRRFIGDRLMSRLLEVILNRLAQESHLSPDLQLYWNNEDFRERETRVLTVACHSPYALENRLVEQAVVVGGLAKERVIDRLIVSEDLRHSSIKAALLVSDQGDERAKSLIKLIATNLIASNLIEDGVELLFLVGSGIDACKYLQSQGQWTKSYVYAKMGLENTTEIETKLITYLTEQQDPERLLAEAARCNWPMVVEVANVHDNNVARIILRTTTSSPPKSPSL